MHPAAPAPLAAPVSRAAWTRFLLCCFVAIFGLRAFVVYKFAASVPLVDEWEATGKEVLAAWQQGTFSWAALFQAHNGDHRIVATRLWELFWFEVNGAWDPKMIMILKALLFAAAGTLFTHLLTFRLPRHNHTAAALFAAAFAFPLGYQNLLWALQSQFDFFLLFSALGWWALLKHRLVLALGLAVAAPFTLGAGAILSASYAAFAVIRCWQREWTLRRAVVFGGCALAILAFAASLRSSEAAPLGSPAEQGLALLKFLSWPYSNFVLLVAQWPEFAHLLPSAVVNFPSHGHSWIIGTARVMQAHPIVLASIFAAFAAVLMAPLAMVTGRVLRRRHVDESLLWPFGLGTFGVLLLVACALARSTEVMVATRFIDVVMLAGFASAAAAIALALSGRTHRRWMALWAVLVLPGYVATMGAAAIQLRHSKESQWLAAVQAYFPAHDRTVLSRNDQHQLPIFETDPTAFANLLDEPQVAKVLPLSVTAPERAPRPFARGVYTVGKFGFVLSLLAAAGAATTAVRARRATQAVPSAHSVTLPMQV